MEDKECTYCPAHIGNTQSIDELKENQKALDERIRAIELQTNTFGVDFKHLILTIEEIKNLIQSSKLDNETTLEGLRARITKLEEAPARNAFGFITWLRDKAGTAIVGAGSALVIWLLLNHDSLLTFFRNLGNH